MLLATHRKLISNAAFENAALDFNLLCFPRFRYVQARRTALLTMANEEAYKGSMIKLISKSLVCAVCVNVNYKRSNI